MDDKPLVPLTVHQEDMVHRYLENRNPFAIPYAVAMGVLSADFSAKDLIRLAIERRWKLSEDGRKEAREIGCLNSEIEVVPLSPRAHHLWEILKRMPVGYCTPGGPLCTMLTNEHHIQTDSGQLTDAKTELVEAGWPIENKRGKGYYRTR